jgi:hypothetical protein
MVHRPDTVMRGHRPSKTGVNALVTRASPFLRNGWIAGTSASEATPFFERHARQ